MSTKFPYCCAALLTADACDMVFIEQGEISWFNGQKEVVTVKACPFCEHVEDDTIALTTLTSPLHSTTLR